MINVGDTVWVVLRPIETANPEDGNIVKGRVGEVIRTTRENSGGQETETKYEIDIGLQRTTKSRAFVYGLEERDKAVTAAWALIVAREEGLKADMEEIEQLKDALPPNA